MSIPVDSANPYARVKTQVVPGGAKPAYTPAQQVYRTTTNLPSGKRGGFLGKIFR